MATIVTPPPRLGHRDVHADLKVLLDYATRLFNTIANINKALLPVGSIVEWAGPTAPADFLELDGRAVKVSDFPDLFAALGGASSPWGAAADGSTFTLKKFTPAAGAPRRIIRAL